MQCFVLLRLTDQPQLANPDLSGRRCGWGDVATYVNGYAFKPSDYSDSGLPIVRIQNLTGNAYRTNRYEGTLPEKFAIQDGDILISWSASLGVFEWNQGPAWLNQHIFRVVFNKAMIDKRFFVHQARFLIQKSQNLAHGATMKHLTKKVFETLPFLYLGLDNQITIAEQLDALDTQINRAKRQIRFLDNLAKSRFVEMFGDPAAADTKHELLAIGNFADVQTGATPLRRKPQYYGGSIPWVKTGEVACNFANGVEEDITEVAIKETNCKVFPAGTVLVAMYGQGDTRGKAAILPFEAATNQACAAILPSSTHNEVFLNAQLQLLYEDMRAKSLGGNQKNLSLGIIKSMKVILPSMEAQQEFASFASQVDKSRFVRDHEMNFR